jgi:citrate lyase subunit beta/citryl-CoA lyase
MRRSLLFIPANNPAMMQNSLLFQADGIIYDLEDAVSIKDKDSARTLLTHFLETTRVNCEIIVRINGLDTPEAKKDLESIVSDAIDTIMLPKADPEALSSLDTFLTSLEEKCHLKKKIKIIPIIELAMSLLDVRAIARAKRVDGILLGAEDFTKDMEVERTKDGLEILMARSLVATCAKAYKIDAIDTPFTDTSDEEGLIKDCILALKLAMNAKACIHPNQIPIVNAKFSPSPEAIVWAKKVVEASQKHETGAFSLEGKMIDKPIIERCQKILAKARKFGL